MQTATNPVTGERLTLQNGQWVPLVESTPAPVQAAAPRPRPASVRQSQASAPVSPAPVVPQAPATNDLGISSSQEMESLVRQGYSLEDAQRFASQPESTGPVMPEAPATATQTATNPETGEVLTLQNGQWVPAAPTSTGYELPEGVVDYETLTDDQRNNLTRGTRVLLPADAPGQSRQIVTLARDMNAPQRDAIMGEDQQTFGGVQTYVPGMADAVAGFASGAAEQVPGLDEGINLADALMSSGSFSDSRDEYQLMQQALNRSNRGERTAGGLAGFAGSLILPGSVGLKGLQGMTGVGRTAAAAAGAAPLGAAYGFASGEGGAADRAPGAVLGGLLGGGAAGVLDAGVRAAPNIASGVSEAGAVISRGFGRAPREAEITPRATQSAQEYVARLLESSGSDLTGNATAAMGKPITAAEAIGPSGVSNMAALTRRAGRAGTMAQGQLGARAVEQSNRVVQDFADLTGMDPAGSADMIQNLATAGRARAAPLYEAAYAAQVQPSSVIDGILQRPVGQAALRRAYRIARNEGRNPEEIGLFVSTRNDGLRTGASRPVSDADLNADLDALRMGTRTTGAGRGPSLIDFISRNGGVRDDGGELAQIGANNWSRQGSWRTQAVKDTGLDLETMAQRALDAGYFDDLGDVAGDVDNYQRLGAQDLINAIDDELRGTPRYGRAEGDTDRSAAAVLRRDRRNALEERLAREGIDISSTDNATVSRLLGEADDAEARNMAFLEGDGPGEPMIDLLPGQTPSMQTLDYVKRGLDDVLDGYRDSTTRRLNLNEEGRSVLNTVSQFREELIRLTGGEAGPYAQALSAGGDPIRLEQAFGRADRLFQVGTSQRAFNTAIERMGEAERNALVAGYADRLFREAQAGRLTTRQLNQVNVPVTREKLATLIGADGADSFMQRITAEIDLARTGGRMAPGTNSITAEALEAMRDQDQGVGLGADFARALATSRGDVVSATLSTAGKALAAPIAGFVRGATAPAAQPVRDEIARLLLMPPDDLASLLSRSGDLSRREATDLASALQRASPDAPQAGPDEFAFPPIATPNARRGGRQ